MKTLPARIPSLWHGVRMRAHSAAEPDAMPRAVTLPATWPDAAAVALAGLVPGAGPASLATASHDWLAATAAAGGMDLARRCQILLLAQRVAPGLAIWRNEADLAPGAILNLAAFYEPGLGFDQPELLAAVDDAVSMVAALSQGRVCVGLSGLAGAIAACGLDYDSDAARAMATAVAAAVRTRLRDSAATAGRAALLVVAAPGPVDALLGIETGGIAPAFSPLDGEGRLSRAARALLAARGVTPEAALAAMLAGQAPLACASHAAHAAMHAAMAPLLDAMPTLEAAPASPQPRPATVQPRALPSRRGGLAHKVGVAGHRLFLRTGEYADGTLGEVAITLPKESPAVRAWADCLAQAVSIGLQHGTSLAAFVEAFSGTHFSPAGSVEGDETVPHASSPADYVFRKLAASYLPGMNLPAAEDEPPPPPLLPLDLPQEPALQPRRRGLRVVR